MGNICSFEKKVNKSKNHTSKVNEANKIFNKNYSEKNNNSKEQHKNKLGQSAIKLVEDKYYSTDLNSEDNDMKNQKQKYKS